MSDAPKAIEYAHKNYERFTRELSEFIKIESISTDDAYKAQVEKAAENLRALRDADDGLGLQRMKRPERRRTEGGSAIGR